MLASTAFPPPEFQAPPPSPEGVERSGEAGEGDVLEEYLSRGDNATAVLELVLPDRLFPRQIHSADPPEVDFRSLGAPSSIEDLRSAARTIGCFQLVNHGIPREVISDAKQAAAAAFLLPPEKKAGMRTSSSARRCGFEGDGEGRDEELFWWSHGGEGSPFDASEQEMAGIWPSGYRDFSCKMGRLQREVGKIASKVGQVLFSKGKLETLQVTESVKQTTEEAIESTLHINRYRQGQGCPTIEGSSPYALQHDAVRLLIRSCEHPRALCIHVTRCSVFQVFSKRGWVSFHPNNEALVVTIGNQMPAWRGSLYRHVAGKPIFPAKDEASISIAVLYSCTTMEKVCTTTGDDKKTISLAQQAILALSLTLLYHIIVHLCGNM